LLSAPFVVYVISPVGLPLTPHRTENVPSVPFADRRNGSLRVCWSQTGGRRR